MPRAWSETEVELVRETGERIWAAVERARAKASLRDSEAVFRTLGEALLDFLWMTYANGRPIYQNPAWHASTGLTQEDLVRDGWQIMPHPDDLPRLQAIWENSTRAGVPFAVEYLCRRFDGTYRWLLSRTVPVKDAVGCIVK